MDKVQSVPKRKQHIWRIWLIFIICVSVVGVFCHTMQEKKEEEKEREFQELLKAGDLSINVNSEEALKKYLEAAQIKPEDSDIYIKIAEAYLDLDALEYALENYQKSMAINPKSALSYQGVLKVCLQMNQLKIIPDICKNAISNIKDEDKQFFSEIEKDYEDYQRYLKYQECLENFMYNSGQTWDGMNLICYGNCYEGLIDFDGDTIEEIVNVYTDSSSNMILEIWGYEKGEMKRIFEGTPYRSAEGNYDVVVLTDEETSYILLGDDFGNQGNSSYYTLSEEKFLPIADLEIENKEIDIYRMQGSYKYSDLATIKNAFETERLVETKVEYLVESLKCSLREKIMGSNEQIAEGTVEKGNYIFANDNLILYLLSYRAENGNLELRIWFEPVGIKNCDYGFGDDVRFVFDTETEVYKEVVYIFNEDTVEFEDEVQTDTPYTISVEQGTENVIIELKDGENLKDSLRVELECIEKW